MRGFFLAIIIIGALLRLGYPLYISNFTGEKLAELALYQRGGAWVPVKTQFEREMFPVGVKVRIKVDAPSDRLATSGSFILKVRGPGSANFTDILDFSLQPVGDGNVDGAMQELWQTATTLKYAGEQPYFFAMAPRANNPLSVQSAHLQLTANIGTYDSRVLLAGTGMMALGGIGFVLMSLRNRDRTRQKEEGGGSSKSRWGRRS